MNLRVAICLAIGFLAILGLACHRNSSTPESTINNIQADYKSEEAAVVSAIIREMYVDDRTQLLVIEHADPCPTPEPNETPDPKVIEMRQHMEDYAFKEMSELTRETIDDFHLRIGECHQLANELDVSIKYVLVGSKDLEPLFPKGEVDRGWSRFYAKYAHSPGIIQFSNPGFNRNYTQAVISTGRWCGGLCGAGYFVLLTKDGGVWKMKNKVGTWVS
jgi:hypothetical protein